MSNQILAAINARVQFAYVDMRNPKEKFSLTALWQSVSNVVARLFGAPSSTDTADAILRSLLTMVNKTDTVVYCDPADRFRVHLDETSVYMEDIRTGTKETLFELDVDGDHAAAAHAGDFTIWRLRAEIVKQLPHDYLYHVTPAEAVELLSAQLHPAVWSLMSPADRSYVSQRLDRIPLEALPANQRELLCDRICWLSASSKFSSDFSLATKFVAQTVLENVRTITARDNAIAATGSIPSIDPASLSPEEALEYHLERSVQANNASEGACAPGLKSSIAVAALNSTHPGGLNDGVGRKKVGFTLNPIQDLRTTARNIVGDLEKCVVSDVGKPRRESNPRYVLESALFHDRDHGKRVTSLPYGDNFKLKHNLSQAQLNSFKIAGDASKALCKESRLESAQTEWDLHYRMGRETEKEAKPQKHVRFATVDQMLIP